MSSQGGDPRHHRLTVTAATSPLYSSVSQGCAGVARKPIPEDTFPLACIKEKMYLSAFKGWELACKIWTASFCRRIRGARPSDARSRLELSAGSRTLPRLTDCGPTKAKHVPSGPNIPSTSRTPLRQRPRRNPRGFAAGWGTPHQTCSSPS